ncbi:hypothetical protein [Tuanshanicoccus lijuaniae]|uniref:hypothetical protein n=1 Tax=Aerococcaceae bacterium zg-1292 TaxID=2774330 RepID=UPI001BD83801|nr:hypothetical protein [Aerococcaceae bacterium zg-A91]MBS4457160.1 hypothetical protein [Aerococcaceae bacterium zg-BR33]
MFHQVRFDIKRIWKKKLLLLLFVLSAIVSYANIIVQNSNTTTHSLTYLLIEGVNYLSPLLEKTKDEDPLKLSPGKEFWEEYRYEQRDNKQDAYTITENYFPTLKKALEMDNVQLTKIEKEDLDYAIRVYQRIEQKKKRNPDYQYRGASTFLLEGNRWLYGIVPFILLSAIMIWLTGEDFDRKESVFNRSLPIARTSVLLSRFFTSLILVALYFGSVTVSTLVLSSWLGLGVGDWLIPLRTAITVLPQLLMYQVLLIVWLLFTVKVMVVIGLSLLLVSLIRKVNLVVIGVAYIISLGFIATEFFQPLQTNWNLFHLNYRIQMIGHWESVDHEGYSVYHVINQHLLQPYQWALYIGIVIVLMLLSMIAFKQNGHFHTETMRTRSKIIEFSAFAFETKVESYKINRYLSPKMKWSMILCVVSLMFLLIGLNDYQSHQFLVDSKIINELKSSASSIDEAINKLAQLVDKYKNDPQNANMFQDNLEQFKVEQQYLREYIQLKNRQKDAFLKQDAHQYYDAFEYDFVAHFGKFKEYEEDYKQIFSRQFDYYQNGRFPTLYGETLSRERLALFKERGIRPLANSQFLVTPYDYPAQAGDLLKELTEHQMRDSSILGYWYRLITIYRFDVFLLVMIIVFCGMGYNLDKEGHNGLAWLYILPRSKQHLFHHKLNAALLNGGFIVLVTALLVIGFGLVGDGIGQWQTPMVVYDKVLRNANDLSSFDKSYHWVSLGVVVIKSLGYLTCAMVFMIQLMLLLSTFIKNHFATIALALIISLGGYAVVTQHTFSGSGFLPFIYLNIAALLDNSLIFKVTDANQVLPYGWLIIIGWIIVLYWLTRLRVQKAKLL